MKIPSLLASLCLLVITAPLATAGMVHPGGWHTQADLDRIRAGVAAGREPWKTAWTTLENSDAGLNSKAHVAPENTNNYAIQNDGHTAYVLAVKWVASGDIRYAKAAIQFINDWTATVRTIGDEPMRSGLGGNQMAQAAEILAHGFGGAAGWAPDEVKRAQTWFKTVVYPHPAKGAAANWGTSAMSGMMSMAVFCDDQAMFTEAANVYRHGFLINGSRKGGCCGLTQYIDATGENAESGRDQPHSQGGIAHLVEVALTAWNQGVDLVAYNDATGVRDYGSAGDNRLWRGLEYTAKYNLGNDVPYHPFFEYCNDVTIYPQGVSDKGRGNYSPVWEMACHLFQIAKLDAPYCRQVIASPSYGFEKGNGDHPGLGMLTFRTEVSGGAAPR